MTYNISDSHGILLLDYVLIYLHYLHAFIVFVLSFVTVTIPTTITLPPIIQTNVIVIVSIDTKIHYLSLGITSKLYSSSNQKYYYSYNSNYYFNISFNTQKHKPFD